MFALSAPLIIGVAGTAMDYTEALAVRSNAQSAADTAALAAAAAARNGMTLTQAQAIGQAVFAANFPDKLTSATGASVVVTSPSANHYQAVASVIGTTPTLLSNIVGVSSMPVDVTATAASATVSGGGGALHDKGNGYSVSDPHVRWTNSATGKITDLTVDCADKGWYNYLSDGGIQWNSQCMAVSGSPYMGASEILVGTHTINYALLQTNFGSGDDDYSPSGDCVNNSSVSMAYYDDGGSVSSVTNCGQAWPSVLTVDGVVIRPGSFDDGVNRVVTLIDDVAEGVSATAEISGWAIPGGWTSNTNYANYVDIDVKTPNYEILITMAWGWQDVWIDALNAGMCGAPGGVYGNFIAGAPDTNYADFQVASATTTGAQFGWTSACGGGATSYVAYLSQ